MDLDFQAITEIQSQNQPNNQQSWYEEFCRKKMQKYGGGGFVEGRGSTGVGCVRGWWVNIVSPQYMYV